MTQKMMKAWVIREQRHGEPLTAFQLEEMPVPEPGPTEVIVKIEAAGINYNGVWACLGKPRKVSQLHPEIEHHIAGSDGSGVVSKIGSHVQGWKVGDEVIVSQIVNCGQCRYCCGNDVGSCVSIKAWGYETSWGSFGQYAKVNVQQLLRKPKHLSWEESAAYGLCFFTAYSMLVSRCQLKLGDLVLVWGAAGGLGVYALQICKNAGVPAIAIVSSKEKMNLCWELGARWVINRSDFGLGDGAPVSDAKYLGEVGKKLKMHIRDLTDGRDPNIIFEHVGKLTFSTSVYLCDKHGKVVICGATTGFDLNFDVRHLWMQQKSIIGSHGAHGLECYAANELMIQKKILPVVNEIVPFDQLPQAHQRMFENKHSGKMVVRVCGA